MLLLSAARAMMCANYYLQSFFRLKGILRRAIINIVLNFRLNVDSKTFFNVILSDLNVKLKRSLSLKIHNVGT